MNDFRKQSIPTKGENLFVHPLCVDIRKYRKGRIIGSGQSEYILNNVFFFILFFFLQNNFDAIRFVWKNHIN